MNIVQSGTRTVIVSERDKAIVELLSNGNRTSEIKEALNMNQRTLESVIDKMRRLYGCATREQLVAFFIRNKIIE